MIIEVDLTKDIINQCLPLHYRYAPFKQKYLTLLFPVAAILIIGIGLTVNEPADVNGGNKWMYLYIYAPMLLVLTLWSVFKRNRAGKKILKRLGDNTHYEVEANEDELTFHLSHTTSRNKWPAFPRAVISKEVVLLYQQNSSFLMFHHSFFANDDFRKFKQLVQEHVHQVSED